MSQKERLTSQNRPFDGLICIGGEDWWYHNRGHFDFQIMRRLAKHFPVLFVNSLGVRMPGLHNNQLFATKIARKLKSLSRGLVHVENQFHVFSPLTIPGATGQSVSDWALAPQIKWAAGRAGITKPLLWIHCPAGAKLVDELPSAAVILQRTDRFEAFPEGDAKLLTKQIAKLKAHADLVVYAAPHLMDEEKGSVNDQLLVTHGVDLKRFIEAGSRQAVPADVAAIPGPRIGFIGGIDAHTFDPSLFVDLAAKMPEAQFVLVGGCSLPEDWCTKPNVHQLGRKPYDDIADYMAAMDVLIMPWNDSSWIEGCNPIKLKEYLGVGKPVVTTGFPALKPWRDLVSVAKDAVGFATAIRLALKNQHDATPARKRLRGEDWDAKADLLISHFAKMGLTHNIDEQRTQQHRAA